jgi:uncharacterized protein YlzI (FlbEa/FlbD family)
VAVSTVEPDVALFSKFTMTDSGRPIEINPDFVEQVRHHSEGDATAIYLNGKTGPVIVHENMATVMKSLKGLDAPSAKPAVAGEPVPLRAVGTAAKPAAPAKARRKA